MKILVVCAGNTCRSPAAEAAIRDAAGRAGLDISVASAGTSAGTAGQPPTPAMVDAARARGLDLFGSSRQITPMDLEGVDLVLAADQATRFFVETLLGSGAMPVELLGSYDQTTSIDDIPDPNGGDEAMYSEVLDRIIASAEGVVRRISD